MLHRDHGAYSGAAFTYFFVPNAALIRGQCLSGGGAYLSKDSILVNFNLLAVCDHK